MTKDTPTPKPKPKRRVLRQEFRVIVDSPDDDLSLGSSALMSIVKLCETGSPLDGCDVTVTEAKRARFASVDAAEETTL